MPLPRGIGRLNRDVGNKITRPFAARIPWFAVLHHTGRVTGDPYSAPMMAWRDGQTVTIALTYGSDVDWLKNARVNDSVLTMGGKEYAVGRPRDIPRDEGIQRVPTVVRGALKALAVTEFVEFPIL